MKIELDGMENIELPEHKSDFFVAFLRMMICWIAEEFVGLSLYWDKNTDWMFIYLKLN